MTGARMKRRITLDVAYDDEREWVSWLARTRLSAQVEQVRESGSAGGWPEVTLVASVPALWTLLLEYSGGDAQSAWDLLTSSEPA